MGDFERPVRLIRRLGASAERPCAQASEAEPEPRAPGGRRTLRRAHHLLPLEQRFMFDAAAVATAAEAAHDRAEAHPPAAVQETAPPIQVRDVDPSQHQGRKEVVFVDTSVTDYKTLEAHIAAGIEIQELSAGQSGLAQMARWAQTHEGYDAIHVLSHGTDATLFLGSDVITRSSLASPTSQAELAQLGHALKDGGDLLIYGCDIGQGASGDAWMAELAQATGADVAASTDDTGAHKLGGNWTLEKQTGLVETASPFDTDSLPAYGGLLATFDLTGASGNSTKTVQQTMGSDVIVITATDDVFVVDSDTNVWGGGIANTSGTVMAVASGVGYESSVRISVAGGKAFDLSSFTLVDLAGENKDLTITTNKGSTTLTSSFSSLSWSVSLASATFQGITYADITTNHVSRQFAWGFDDFVLNNITPPPTVTDAKISITSTGSGTGGAYRIGNVVTATWDNTASGDNNASITDVSMDFSQFGGGTAVAATNSGNVWTASYTIGSGSVDATNRNVSVSATNAAGTTTQADSSNLTVDNIAPTVTDANISISGATGTGGAYKYGDTVTARWNNTSGGDNNADISSVLVNFSSFGGSVTSASNSGGTWRATYTLISGSVDSTFRNISIIVRDDAGNSVSRSDSTNATVDTIVPVVNDARISISGATGTGGAFKIGDTITATWNNTASGDNNSDTISGVTVNFSQFGGSSALSASNTGGNWRASYIITAGVLDNTNRNVSVTARDNAGNTTTRADTTNATVDNLAPTVTDSKISISGASGTDGAFKIGDTVTVTWDNTASGDNNADTMSGATVDFSQFGGSASVAATESSGMWTASYTIVAGAVEASNRNVSVTATDNAGNTTTCADTTNATVDNNAPTTTLASVAFSADTGSSATDLVTRTAAQTLSGTLSAALAAGETVQVSLDNGTTWANATATVGQSTWTLAGQTLASSHTLRVRVTDAAGNTGAETTQAYVLDVTAPSTTVATLAFSADTGSSASDFITRTAGQTLSGTLSANLAAGETVQVSLDNGVTWADATATVGQATWSLAGQTLTGSDTLRVRVADNAGNSSAETTQAYVLDVTAPATTVSTLAFSADTGSSATDFITRTAAQALSGTLSANLAAGETVQVSLDNGATWVDATTTVGQGTWSVAGQTLTGNDTLQVRIMDSAGNIGTAATQAYVLDTTAPTTTVSILSFSADTGSSATDFITRTAAQTVSGTLSANLAAGETVQVSLDNGVTWADATATVGQSTWALAGQTLTGSDTVRARVADTAGNSSAEATQAYALDVTAPTTTVATFAFSADSGSSATDFITRTAPQTLSGTLSANLAAGETVQVSLDNGATWSNANATIGQSTWSLAGQTLTGSDTLRVRVTDRAGNSSAQATQAYVLDTTAPSTTVATWAFSADTGGSASDFITRTAAQTLSGTLSANLAAGETVQVSLDNGTTWADATTTVGQSTWALAGQTLASSNTLRVRVTDAAGNTGTEATQTYVFDATAPSTTVDTLALSTDTGSSSTDFITHTATQTLSGTLSTNLAAGETVQVSLDNGTTWTNATASVGQTTWTLAGQTLTGSNTLRARVADTAGNSSAEATQGYVLDATAPATTVATLAFSADTGSSATDFITRTAAQALSGTLSANLASGETVQVSLDNGATWADATATVGQATWSLSGQALASSNTLRVRVTDAAGNTGAEATQAYILDTIAPSTTVATLALSADTGSNATDFITRTAAQTLSGTLSNNLAAGETVQVSLDNGTTWINATATTGQSTWALAGQTLTGSNTLRARVADTAGNSSAEATQAYVLDTTAPSTTVATLAFSADTGSSASDFITRTAAQTLSGTLSNNLAAGETVQVSLDNGTTWTNATATVGQATWSLAGQTLNGSDTLRVRITDTAGNTGTEATQAYVLDTTSPSTTVATLAFSADTGSSATDFITRTAAQTLSGTLSTNLAAGETVQVSLDNGTTWADATTTVGQSTWALAGQTLASSSTLRVRVTDAAGNTGAEATQAYVLDTTAPSTTVATLAFSADTGSSTTDFITRTAAQTLSGTLSANLAAGETVQVSLDNGGTWTNATATIGQSTWALAGQTLASSSTLRVRVTDAAGNTGAEATQAYVLDTTAPSTTVATLAFSADTGSSANDFITRTAAQTLSGTLSANLAAGETVQVSLDNGATWTNATATVGQSTWSLSGQTLASSNTLRVRVTDTAGNTGAEATQAYVLEVTTPSTTVATLAFSDDTGSSATDFITRTATQTLSGTLSANLATGETVQVSLDNGTTWTNATATIGQSTWALAGQTLTGSNTVRVRVMDTAGNTGAEATQAYVLDTTAPSTSVATLAFSTDTGSSASDLITSTAAQTLSGTLSANLAAGETVQVSLDNGATWTNATATVGQSTWALAGQTLTGSNTLRARVIDTAGNTSATTSQAYVLDTAPPSAPIIDALTSTQLTPVLTGNVTLEAGETLVVNVAGASYAVSPTDGHWRVDLSQAIPITGKPAALSAGETYTVTASLTDVAGNVTTASNLLQIIKPNIPPTAQALPVDPVLTQTAISLPPPPTPPATNALNFLSPSTESRLRTTDALPAATLPSSAPAGPTASAVTDTRPTSAQAANVQLPLTQGGDGSSFRVVVLSSPQDAAVPSLVVNRPMGDQLIAPSGKSVVSIPTDIFAHTSATAVVSLSATQANGQALPDWMSFNAQTGKFTLQPPAGVQGELSIKVMARDAQGREAVTTFKIRVNGKTSDPTQRDAPSGRVTLSEQIRQAAKRHSTLSDRVDG